MDEKEYDFEMEVDQDFAGKLEKMQKEILDERDDVWKKINQNFRKEKKKNIAILPTMTSDLNKYITHPRNKLFVI